MPIGVRIKNGTAIPYRMGLDLKKSGIRPTTLKEEIRYWRQKPFFFVKGIKIVK